MTVTYQNQVLITDIGRGFFSLIRRKKGSIYRLLWVDFMLYMFLYAVVSCIYRFLIVNYERPRDNFERLIKYCDSFNNTSANPLIFILGFYCLTVADRWWKQYEAIPWLDTLCMNVSSNLRGTDDETRMKRRKIARYANLAMNMSFVQVSPLAYARFDTLDKFVKEGFLTPNEKQLLEEYRSETKKCKAGFLPEFWIPLAWASSIVTIAREEGKITVEAKISILADLRDLRNRCQLMIDFGWINVPLVYTQIVTIAVYSYFLITLIGKQFIIRKEIAPATYSKLVSEAEVIDLKEVLDLQEIDIYIPFITLMQFLFYMGWLKTAETLFNPFGGDHDGFEIIYMIDRNHEMGYAIVDRLHGSPPDSPKDIHWDSVLPPSHEDIIAGKMVMPKKRFGNLYMALEKEV